TQSEYAPLSSAVSGGLPLILTSGANLATRTLAAVCPRAPRLMQAKFGVEGAELGRLDQLAVRAAHGMQRPFQFFLPESQKTMQLREFGEQVVVLPNVRLQQPAMVGAAVQDVRGRQAVTTHLFTEIL